MEDQRSLRQLLLGMVAGLSAMVLTTGGAVAWWGWQSSHKSPPSELASQSGSPQEQQKAPPVAPGANVAQKPPVNAANPETKTLQVYWLSASGSAIALSPSTVTLSAKNSPNDILAAAVDELLAGPKTATVTTTIPRDTKLLSLSVKDDGIHVDLSQAFTRGGGSTSMTGRVGQVLYTATTLDPTAKVWLLVEGKPLETLGGEGLMLDQPLTRDRFKHDF